jgi:hypothetical protein
LGGRGRQISEFQASLVYRVSSRTARAIQRNPVLEKKKKKAVTLKFWKFLFTSNYFVGDLGKELTMWVLLQSSKYWD